ncbi:MAG: response regulator [Endomicrobiales bacterium]|nr:response regulator [Endomicrobiales bacterium]
MATKILIADDDPEILELLKFTFESEGYEVLTAADGEETLKSVKDEHPDIVSLDINMPKLSGYEVLEKIREDGNTCLIPVVMVTSLSKTKDKITGIKLGADDYLEKPFEPFELLARVEGILKRTGESLSANPLTKLPGNVTVEAEVKKHLDGDEEFAVMYIDMDNFKSYNDKYGFEKGDNIIRLLATILRAAMSAVGRKEDFLGHIGGDDFVMVSSPDASKKLAKMIIEYFDDMIPKQYDEETRQRGFLWGINRQGQEIQFPLMGVSIGVATVEKGKFQHYSQVVEAAKMVLEKAKQKKGSNFEID